MQIDKNYEREIDIRDLFFHIVYRWRSILAAALIGAVALGLFQYLSIESTHREGKLTAEEKQYEIDLQDYYDKIQNYQDNIAVYTKLLDEKNEYKANSILMTIDSQNEWVAIKRYYIQMDPAILEALPEGANQDPADSAAAVYTTSLKNDFDPEEMMALLGTDRREYIDEIVSIWSDNETNPLGLQVIGNSEEYVVRAIDFYSSQLAEISHGSAQQVGAHELLQTSEDIRVRTDPSLSSQQEKLNSDIVSYQAALKKNRQALNEIEDEDEPEPPGTHIKRNAAIGFILGAVLLAGIYFLGYIFSDRLTTREELSERYALRIYGEFPKSRARRPGKGLDGVFEKWERKRAAQGPEEIYGDIAALIGKNCASGSVLLTGTVSEDRLRPLCDQLRGRLGDSVKLEMQADFLRNSGGIDQATQADAVILVEEKYVSQGREIERVAETLAISGAKVCGGIII